MKAKEKEYVGEQQRKESGLEDCFRQEGLGIVTCASSKLHARSCGAAQAARPVHLAAQDSTEEARLRDGARQLGRDDGIDVCRSNTAGRRPHDEKEMSMRQSALLEFHDIRPSEHATQHVPLKKQVEQVLQLQAENACHHVGTVRRLFPMRQSSGHLWRWQSWSGIVRLAQGANQAHGVKVILPHSSRAARVGGGQDNRMTRQRCRITTESIHPPSLCRTHSAALAG